MAPVGAPRQVWMWSLPALVFLLSFVWYKRKRNTLRTDPGGTTAEFVESAEEIDQQGEECQESVNFEKVVEQDISEDLKVEQEKSVPPLVRCESIHEPDSTVTVEKVDEIVKFEVEEPIVQCDKVIDCEAAPKQAAEVIKEEVKEVVVEEKIVPVTSTMKGSEREVAAPVVTMKEKKTDDVAADKVDALEDKLASLALDSSEAQRRGAERDSANHSPVDAMLASPSMSSYSDEHSEGSSDSGKGCSDVASPPSRTPVGSGSLVGDGDSGVDASNGLSVYEFLLPQLLVGRLIGRHGQFVHEIKAKTNASILIKKHPETPKQKVCAIEGTQMDIDNALAMIRDRFPLRKYPNVTLEQVSFSPAPTLVPDFCQLHLVEGVNNEVMISSLVSPAHMFVQQPYHPSYQFLTRLNVMMNSVYTQVEAPNLPDPIEVGNICVAPAVDGWYRAQVVATDEESQTSEIKFVDYGGYMSVNNSVLRQIRQDFMTLPFQATECYLANIKPTGETGEWSLDALRIVEELTRGQMLLVQVYDYAADNVPLIYLYSSVNSQLVLINQELVARGMAELDDTAGTGASSEAASLVVAAAAAAGMTSTASTTVDSNSSKSECEDKSSTIVSSSQANPPQVTAN